MAAHIFEMTGTTEKGEEHKLASLLLESGEAYKKFVSICNAQGGLKEPQFAKHSKVIYSNANGVLAAIDNRKLARIAKLAGAPDAPGAGILMTSSVGDQIHTGDGFFTVYAESKGELEYALDFYKESNDIFKLT
jgi:thymidine phosphorylase